RHVPCVRVADAPARHRHSRRILLRCVAIRRPLSLDRPAQARLAEAPLIAALPLPSTNPPIMKSRPFGQLPSGTAVELYTLTNAAGASLDVITYGGIITALRMPDRQGAFADVVLGFNGLAPYAAGHPFFGALVGRVAGRITKGALVLPG